MKERVRQFWEAFARGDLEGGLALLSDNIVFTISGTTLFSGAIVGKDALRAHLQRFGASLEPGAQMHVRERIAEGDVVVCLSEGTMRAKTGRDYNNTYAGVFRFADEQIVSVTEFLDTALIETALCGKTIH